MAYKHRVEAEEQASGLLGIVSVDAGLPVIFGVAPVNMVSTPKINEPVLVQNYTEAVASFGYVPPKLDKESGLKKFEYSICEFIRSQFQLFGYGPVIIVNVLDPDKHTTSMETTSITLDAKKGNCTIEESGIIASTIALSNGDTTYKKDTDFETGFDDDGNLVITSLTDDDGNFLCATETELTITADKLDPSKVTSDDIEGGVTVEEDGTIKNRGLECLEDIFPRLGKVPGICLAPGYTTPIVATLMASKMESVNEVFKGISVVDLPTDEVRSYSDAYDYKSNHAINDPRTIACWPMIAYDSELYHLSTQLTALMNKVDSSNGDIPYESPSNKNLQMDSCVLEDGTEIPMSLPNAETVNGNGVVTALNFYNGFVAFGNRTACYPSNTDAKDAFIPIKRMFAWIENTTVLTCWQRLDKPLNRRQVDTIVDTMQQWLNGLVAQQALLEGTIEFLEEDNTTQDLSDGIAVFRYTLCPPSPNRVIQFKVSYDADANSTLFSSAA